MDIINIDNTKQFLFDIDNAWFESMFNITQQDIFFKIKITMLINEGVLVQTHKLPGVHLNVPTNPKNAIPG